MTASKTGSRKKKRAKVCTAPSAKDDETKLHLVKTAATGQLEGMERKKGKRLIAPAKSPTQEKKTGRSKEVERQFTRSK